MPPRTRSRLLSLTLLLALSGCLPARTSYYGISSPEGTVAGDCGSLGKRSSLSFQRGDIEVYIPTVLVGGDEATVRLILSVPPADVLRLDWDGMQIADTAGGSVIPGNRFSAEVVDRRDGHYLAMPLQPGAAFRGDAYPAHLGYDGSQVFTTYTLAGSFPASAHDADFRFPDVWLNGVLYPGFVIHYHWQTGWWLQSANC